jgi:predicted AAA+ superfamily ATPase
MENEYLPLLNKQNIWWEGKIENDPHIQQWMKHERRWIPHQLDELPVKAFCLNLVIGPRQSGKTTLIKLSIKKLLENGINPKSILYARCDEILDIKELREVLETFFAYCETKDVFIFLDEITDIEKWEKVIKGFIDDGDFRNAAVTVSGSNAFQLQKGSELFPGRRGNGKDIFVLPLLFREYISVVDPELSKKISVLKDLDKIQEIKKLLPLKDEFQKHLYNYFACGGFPLSVLSYLKNKKISERAKETYRSWIIGDILKAGKSDVIGREVLKVILSKAPSPISWEAISQETSIKSPPTAASYVELFERLFLVNPLYAVKPDKRTKDFAKNKKLLLPDPFLWHLCEEWCMQAVSRKTEVIAEATLASHLARFLATKYKGKRFSDYVSYWKNGYEIDSVVHEKDKLIGFEMKWSDRKNAFPFRVGPMDLIYVSKGTYREEKPGVVPLAVFLAVL